MVLLKQKNKVLLEENKHLQQQVQHLERFVTSSANHTCFGTIQTIWHIRNLILVLTVTLLSVITLFT